MNTLRSLALASVVAAAFTVAAPMAQDQVGFDFDFATGPECPYGYYDFEPYYCAPYGYYGPEWFLGGIFIGAGPWFRGRHDFRGHVDHRYDPRYGYHGPYPRRGEPRHPDHHMGRIDGFKGSEMRDGRGNAFGHQGGPGGGRR